MSVTKSEISSPDPSLETVKIPLFELKLYDEGDTTMQEDLIPVITDSDSDKTPSIIDLSKALLENKANDSQIWCFLCNDVTPATFWTKLFLHCVIRHMPRSHYLCSICDFNSMSHFQIIHHYEKDHNDHGDREIDLKIGFDHAEMTRMLHRCFDRYHTNTTTDDPSLDDAPSTAPKRPRVDDPGTDPPDRLGTKRRACGLSMEGGNRITAPRHVFPVSAVWARLKERIPSHGILACNVCQKAINFKGTKKSGYKKPNIAIEHALDHLGISQFQCRFCAQRFSHFREISAHAENYKFPGLSERMYIDVAMESFSVARKMEECFGKRGQASTMEFGCSTQPRPPEPPQEEDHTEDPIDQKKRCWTDGVRSDLGGTPVADTAHSTMSASSTIDGERVSSSPSTGSCDKAFQHTISGPSVESSTQHSTVFSLCREAVIPYIVGKCLHCSLCGKDVVVQRERNGGVYIQGSVIDQHALSHAKHLQIYRCKDCAAYCANTVTKIQTHLENQHSITSSFADHYVSDLHRYHEEITDLIKRCFISKAEIIGDEVQIRGQSSERGSVDDTIDTVLSQIVGQEKPDPKSSEHASTSSQC